MCAPTTSQYAAIEAASSCDDAIDVYKRQGVEIPTVTIDTSELQMPYGYMGSNSQLDQAYICSVSYTHLDVYKRQARDMLTMLRT